MAMSRLESRRRQLKALQKDTQFNPEVSDLPVLPVGSEKVIVSEFPPTTQKYKAFLKAAKARYKKLVKGSKIS
ncbi:MAG: hypothetical protein K0S11_919 [Gammaproteobacteria bacterium]|jgi:hypothetical protein|nr:hypothetical protein [Gammaproteobacteria bacterium]